MFASINDELKFSREQGFFDKSRAVRWTLVALIAIALFIFLHIREVVVEMLEIGSPAPRYVIADVDFTYVDKEAQTILTQEALLDIGKIYQIDADDVHRRKIELENSLLYSQEWRGTVRGCTFDEMYRAVERLQRTLIDLRFCDSRTIEKMKELGLPIKNFIELSAQDLFEGIIFNSDTWNAICEVAYRRTIFHKETIEYIKNFLKDKIWVLKLDDQSQRRLRKAITASIPPKVTQMPAGTRIVDLGDKVNSQHIDMLQAMKQAKNELRNVWDPKAVVGTFLLVVVVLILSGLFLKVFHPHILFSNRRLFLLITVILLTLIISKITEFLYLRSSDYLFELLHFPVLLPFLAILLTSLINPTIGLFFSCIVAILMKLGISISHYGWTCTNFLAAFMTVICTRSMRKRTDIFVVFFKSWIVMIIAISGFGFYDRGSKPAILAGICSSGVYAGFSAILVVGLLPLLESSFKILTDITLMEFMDPNNELLKRLMIEAPGTYQHALIAGHIAEAAAQNINSNGLFCRVAMLYHDIGKISIAQYFTENQQQGVNIHQLLTPLESAQVIMSHVSEGVALGRKFGLPEQFIDIIKEHHGTTLVFYFYHKAVESAGGNQDLVDQKAFRYLGPKPHTKESVIIMIADCFEAASRSLDEMNEETMSKLIDQIVKEKLEDGQFDDSMLTFEELGIVKRSMVKQLLTIGHFRVKYPSRLRPRVTA